MCAVLFSEEAPSQGEEAAATPVDTEGATGEATKKAGVKMSYEEYKHLANLLVLYMRRIEEEQGEENILLFM